MFRNKTLKYVPAILIALGIAVASLWENPQLPKVIATRDLWIHGVMYAVLALALMIPVAKQFPARALPYIYVCAGTIAYGALIEILQRFCTLSRTGTMADLYADALGALIAVSLVALINHKSSIINHQS